MQTDPIGRVAALFDLTRAELTSTSRKRHIVEARQAAAWVLRHAYPRISLQTIGEQIGGRDHTTVIYAIARTAERMRADHLLDTQLRAMIGDPPPAEQQRDDTAKRRSEAYRNAHWHAGELLEPGAAFQDMVIVVNALVDGASDAQALAELAKEPTA